MNAKPDSERGSITVELAVIAPLTGLLLACVVLVGRVQSARADLESAARSAARELSLARSPETAIEGARTLAEEIVGVGGPSCRTLAFETELLPDTVTVTVRCAVDLDAVAPLPVPGTTELSATATEVRDRFREG